MYQLTHSINEGTKVHNPRHYNYTVVYCHIMLANNRSLTQCLAFKYLLTHARYSKPAKTGCDKYMLICILAFLRHHS